MRDGKLNSDVRDLNGVNAIWDATQSILYNALAHTLASTSSGPYSKDAASFIQTFFLDPKVGMNPDIKFGQLIRGPGTQSGQYLGVLDLRCMVKLANAVLLMRAQNAPEWTSSLDQQLNAWATQYVNWLQTSDLGQQAESASK